MNARLLMGLVLVFFLLVASEPSKAQDVHPDLVDVLTDAHTVELQKPQYADVIACASIIDAVMLLEQRDRMNERMWSRFVHEEAPGKYGCVHVPRYPIYPYQRFIWEDLDPGTVVWWIFTAKAPVGRRGSRMLFDDVEIVLPQKD